MQGAHSDAPLVDSASLPLEHRAVYGPPSHLPPPPAYGPPQGGGIGGGDDSWPLATPDMPQIKHLQVQCEKTNMRVNIEFDRPFYGMIFSKGEISQDRFAGDKNVFLSPEIYTNILKCNGLFLYINLHYVCLIQRCFPFSSRVCTDLIFW